MEKARRTAKLALHRETLQRLDPDELRQAAGGAEARKPTKRACPTMPTGCAATCDPTATEGI
jgi:hypothetical protein